MEAVYEIDNNRYAFLFDREVFRYFTEYVLNQPADRLKWGYGRIIHHENLYDLVVSLKEKNKLQKAGERPDQEEEYKILPRRQMPRSSATGMILIIWHLLWRSF